MPHTLTLSCKVGGSSGISPGSQDIASALLRQHTSVPQCQLPADDHNRAGRDACSPEWTVDHHVIEMRHGILLDAQHIRLDRSQTLSPSVFLD
ncbi:hypothetical protein AAFF_G00149660 [Aldrovandia affinis]|uniref:Uncharacterized protein n=1 Tax=Aldrovandia affinis TaxID=143900 RepID=A0AAD7RPL5_9TELE|nr:hypothetical protein AAFF_G00149660 [Aldrovandia affinis]